MNVYEIIFCAVGCVLAAGVLRALYRIADLETDKDNLYRAVAIRKDEIDQLREQDSRQIADITRVSATGRADGQTLGRLLDAVAALEKRLDDPEMGDRLLEVRVDLIGDLVTTLERRMNAMQSAAPDLKGHRIVVNWRRDNESRELYAVAFYAADVMPMVTLLKLATLPPSMDFSIEDLNPGTPERKESK